MRGSRRGAEITMQSMSDVLERWHRVLHVWTLLVKDDTTENKKYISSVLDLFSIPNFYIRKGRPHGSQGTGRKKVAKNSRQNNSKRGVERNNMKTLTVDLSVTRRSERR